MLGSTDIAALPVYIPNPKVCHTDQYHCCKRRIHCRLWHRCAQIGQQTVCKRDCPSCIYEGCSLPADQRKTAPIYVASVIQGERINLNLQGRYWQEQMEHRTRHRKQYYFYNCLWGEMKEKNRELCRRRYLADPEYYRMLARESYKRRHPKALKAQTIDERLLPECGLRCDTCTLPDCNLPDDWLRKAQNGLRNQKYRENNKEKLKSKQQLRRLRPEVKAQRAAYDKEYRRNHPEAERAKQRRYREKYPERIRSINRAYYQKNKDKINARRREKRGFAKSNADSAHCEV